MERVMVIVEGELVVDYAYPCMMAERALKEAHAAMLKGNHDEAHEAGLKAITEAKLMLHAITIMKERQR